LIASAFVFAFGFAWQFGQVFLSQQPRQGLVTARILHSRHLRHCIDFYHRHGHEGHRLRVVVLGIKRKSV
jgi:hypothetical protein